MRVGVKHFNDDALSHCEGFNWKNYKHSLDNVA